ncbi:hypothetical protein E2562_029882 [Oryza meyeriana var. granulata]|uniref:Uncharacterized protein n=1 Tax=Oryza meyeriana var. granulata TaxID=110450 RepID=A0A6G1CV53_9ORYZ|nr:hypothetical protein E2562_029882 [Oryza meyeriana var. granulata]
MAAILRNTIVVAMGAGALGVPDALRLLLDFAGRSPLVDILIAVFVIAAFTAPALGTMLLARFFRKTRAETGAGGGATGAAVADPFAKMTLAVSLAVAVLVSASLLVLPLFHAAGAAPAALATGRSIKATLLVSLATICLLLLVPRVADGILDPPAQRLLAFALKNPLANVSVGVATATVVGTTLLALFRIRTKL